MIYWGIMLFGLGVLALADYSVTGGEVFGSINSIIFLTLSFAVLVRIRNKEKEGKIEKLQEENNHLRQVVTEPDSSTTTKKQMTEAPV